jgi:3-oxoadipate enol-lactonase
MNIKQRETNVETQVLTSAGPLQVQTRGNKDQSPVLLWPSVFADLSMYFELAQNLEENHFLILVDGPGHGKSGAAPKGAGIKEHGQSIIEILDHFSIDAASIIGTSWGGMAGLIAAAEHSKRISKLILLNTPFYLGARGKSMANRLIVSGTRLIGHSKVMINGIASSFFLESTRIERPKVVEDFFSHIQKLRLKDLANAVGSVLLSQTSLLPYLSQIKAKTLVVTGSEDSMYPIQDMKTAADMISDSTFEVVNTSHISLIDKPTETMKLIKEFLS